MRRVSCVIGATALCLSTMHASGGAPRLEEEDTSTLSRSLAAAEQRLGPVHPDLLMILGSLAQARFRDADITEATALRRRSLKISIRAFGHDSAPAADAMIALASAYIASQRYLDAEPLLITAGNILTAELGDEEPAMVPVLSGLARIALARGDNSAARKWVSQAVVIDQNNELKDRSGLPRTLGAVLAAEQRFDESARILDHALALDREGADEFATARSLSQLANTYLREKRFADALPLIEEATAIDQTRLGATHPLIADDLHDLGLVYLESKRSADAGKVFRAALNLLNRGASRDTPRAAYIELALARAVHQQGGEGQSETLFSEAGRILNAAEEEEHEREREI